MRESLLPALSVGALGFCSGAVRFLAISHQELGSLINIVSMATLLVTVVAFFVVWRMRTIAFSLTTVFRILFPITATCLVALPFAGDRLTNTVAAISYTVFMLATVLMMMHCAQISRDSGINPLFIYAFYGLVAYACQTLGYLAGGVSHSGFDLGIEQLSLVSLFALFAMLMVSLFGRRPYSLHTDRLEFLTPAPCRRGESSPTASASAERSDSHPSETGHLTNASRATSLGASAHAAALDLTAQEAASTMRTTESQRPQAEVQAAKTDNPTRSQAASCEILPPFCPGVGLKNSGAATRV